MKLADEFILGWYTGLSEYVKKNFLQQKIRNKSCNSNVRLYRGASAQPRLSQHTSLVATVSTYS